MSSIIKSQTYSLKLPVGLNVELIHSEYDSGGSLRNTLFLFMHPIAPEIWRDLPELNICHFFEQSAIRNFTPLESVANNKYLAFAELLSISREMQKQKITASISSIPFVLLELPINKLLPRQVRCTIESVHPDVSDEEQGNWPFKRLNCFWPLNEVLPVNAKALNEVLPVNAKALNEVLPVNAKDKDIPVSDVRARNEADFAVLASHIRSAIVGVRKRYTVLFKLIGTGYRVNCLDYASFCKLCMHSNIVEYEPSPVLQGTSVASSLTAFLDIKPMVSRLVKHIEKTKTSADVDVYNKKVAKRNTKTTIVCNLPYQGVNRRTSLADPSLDDKFRDQFIYLTFKLGVSHELVFIIPPAYYPAKLQLKNHIRFGGDETDKGIIEREVMEVMDASFVHNGEFIGIQTIIPTVVDNHTLKLESANADFLQEIAMRIGALKPPEPYKGKGIVINTKASKLKRKEGKKK